jgi:hypothetical protein
VDILARFGAAQGDELRDKREDRVPDYFGLPAEAVEVEGSAGQPGGYGGADVCGDDGAVGLGAGEGGFGVDAAGDVGGVVEDLGGLSRGRGGDIQMGGFSSPFASHLCQIASGRRSNRWRLRSP